MNQGATIKPLVDLLNIDKEDNTQKKLMEELNDYVVDNIYNGVNRIIGNHSFGVLQNRKDINNLLNKIKKDNPKTPHLKSFVYK